jgi:hypothetical protein
MARSTTTQFERNAALAVEYLEWPRKRNRARATPVASTDTLEAFVERPRRRRRPHHAAGTEAQEQLLL